MCGCQSQSTRRVQPLKFNEITAFATKLSIVNADEMSVGIATMPTGEQIWYASSGGNFATELFGYHITGSVSYANNEVTVKAAASKDAKEIASFALVLELNNSSINKLAYIKSINSKSDGTLKPEDALADCIKRHGKDIGICCALFGCDDTCLELVAVGVAACCLVNVNC